VFGAAGRCKLYRLEKGETGTDEYKDFGSGILRLNKHKETGRRRVRGSGSDSISGSGWGRIDGYTNRPPPAGQQASARAVGKARARAHTHSPKLT
jgi:hypothetical protein